MAKRRKTSNRSNPARPAPTQAARTATVQRPIWPAAAVGLAMLAIAMWLMLGWAAPAKAPTAAAQTGALGGVTGCRGLPRFGERLGYQDLLAISTSERSYTGLVIFDGRIPLTADLSERDLHQEPSWDDAGTLGPFVLDREGNIYTAPVPRTAVSDTSPDRVNTIYRVDSLSGELQPFVNLPAAPTPTSENPFGILGLAYDCTSNALYVSSVAGSDRKAERGRVLRVDLSSKAVTEEVVGVDVIGLAVFQGPAERRLYMGLARSAELGSVALDASGAAIGAFRSDLRFDDLAAGFGEPRARRISFDQANMTLFVVPFNFNLRAVSEQQQITLRYGYDAQRDEWVGVP